VVESGDAESSLWGLCRERGGRKADRKIAMVPGDIRRNAEAGYEGDRDIADNPTSLASQPNEPRH